LSPWDADIAWASFYEYGFIDWEEVPDYIKRNDPRFALRGVKEGKLNPDECPALLNPQFMKYQFEEGEIVWEELPTALKTNIEFARSIESFPTTDYVRDVLEHFPLLRNERVVWVKAVDADNCDTLYAVVEEFAPAEILSDRELMLTACTNDAGTLDHVQTRLAEDHDFLLALAGGNHHILYVLTHELQRRYNDVVDAALQQYYSAVRRNNEGDVWEIVDNLLPELWNNRDFVLRWFRGGLPFWPRFAGRNGRRTKKSSALWPGTVATETGHTILSETPPTRCSVTRSSCYKW